MFDNLRESADSSFYEEEPNDLYKEPAPSTSSRKPTASAAPKKRRKSSGRFLGMTAQQRFIVSLMLMLTVCLMGIAAMFLTGRMSLF